MAATGKLYGTPVKNQYDGTAVIDWDTDTIKCALTTSSYTPDQDAHDFFNDVTNEVVGTGYSAGGATLGSKTVTYTGGTNVIAIDAADATWASSTITARIAVVYKDTGVAATSPLFCYQQESGDISTTAGTFTVQWAAAGIGTITVS